jgi:hypothetical protein
VRHSTEKDHVRWGLRALENLTFIEHGLEMMDSLENETSNGELNLNVVNFYENNVSDVSMQFNQSSEIGPYELDYSSGNLHNVSRIPKKIRLDNLYSTGSPLYFTPQPSLSGWIGKHGKSAKKRKKIMANIKSTVNKGVEYLKSHKKLKQVKIDIEDDFKDITNKRTQSVTKIDKPSKMATKQIKFDISKDDEQNIQSSTASPFAHPLNLIQHNVHQDEDDQTDGKLYSNKLKLPFVEFDENDDTMLNDQPPASAVDERKNKADVEITVKPQKDINKISKHLIDSKKNDIKSQNKNHLSSTIASTVASTTSVPAITTKFSPVQQSGKKSKKNDNKIMMNKMYDNQERLASEINEFAEHKDGENGTHSNPTNLYTNDNDSYDDNLEHLDEDNVNNDDINGGNSNENFVNAISEDEEVDLENVEENIHLTGIYHVEDLDLSDLDETSRANRKNLMRGRDVVTQFLQIVESQHGLGGNCTAGTALNLGEGVVDRYAQDRFRIEAEVAVNRANMLTR